MKLYYPITHYNKGYRGWVFPLLKPFIKSERYTDVERIAHYGVSEADFNITETIAAADFVLLPMSWNYYERTNQTAIAISFVQECALLDKKVIAFNMGDFGVKTPDLKNLVVLRPSGYATKLRENEYSLPVFIEDPLNKYFDSNQIVVRDYTTTPTVGFCGQANNSQINALGEVFKTWARNMKTYSGISKNEVQQVISTSYLRATVLTILQKSTLVRANFILRKKYRAGVSENKDSHSSTYEFYNNLKESDYVVCVRGAGNFSVRFYETLAMGRIPVFINTDCSLPFNKAVNWKKHAVWVEYSERSTVAEKVKEFHATLSQEDFIALQHANRALWKEKLTLNGFFKTFLNEF
ncbi:exostosin domain-containing protein [Rasiella sp. SM2506]|uniref:exostosin domain-containing protein n=1 Tax=Rasiella sp. SM2506 TaxID=3423914 RepID=UPI003D799088